MSCFPMDRYRGAYYTRRVVRPRARILDIICDHHIKMFLDGNVPLRYLRNTEPIVYHAVLRRIASVRGDGPMYYRFSHDEVATLGEV